MWTRAFVYIGICLCAGSAGAAPATRVKAHRSTRPARGPTLYESVDRLISEREVRIRTVEIENLRTLVSGNATLSGAERTSLLAELPVPTREVPATSLGSEFVAKLEALGRRGRALDPLHAALARLRRENLVLLEDVVALVTSATGARVPSIDPETIPYALLGRTSVPAAGTPWQNYVRDELDGIPRGLPPGSARAEEYAIHADPLAFVTKLHAQAAALFGPARAEIATN